MILKSHGTRPGVNAISTCSIRMATNCHLLGRHKELVRTRVHTKCVAVTFDLQRISGSAWITVALTLSDWVRVADEPEINPAQQPQTFARASFLSEPARSGPRR